MRHETETAFKNTVAHAPAASRVTIPAPIQDKLACLASLVAKCRSQVSRNAYDKTVNYLPDIEGPARLAKAFAKLGKGLAAVRGMMEVTEDEYEVIKRVALDTIPKKRRMIISCLIDLTWEGTKGIGNKVDMPTTTVGRELEDLAMIKVVSRDLDVNETDEIRQTTPYAWRLRDEIAIALETTEFMGIIKAC